MTTGQRITAKRKELELSQEALGEQLGVSRQSIYKWESDASLPDIAKLITLSRLFHTSVGWLLGVEEELERQKDDELSERQLRMVEELLSRYQQNVQSELSEAQQRQVDQLVTQRMAAPGPQKGPERPRKRWPYVATAIAVLWGAFALLDRVVRMENQYNGLNSSVNNISQQIGSITRQVEEALQAQNDLTASYKAELQSADLANNTVTFALRVVPRTYAEGMKVVFLADDGEYVVEQAGREGQTGSGREFTAELTCRLTDDISLSAVLISGDTRQTQPLRRFTELYQASLPTDYVDLHVGGLTGLGPSQDGAFHLPAEVGMVRLDGGYATLINTKVGRTDIRELKVGLFKNQTLVQWLEPCERPKNYHTNATEDEARFFGHPELTLELEEGDTLHYAAFVTDEYDRTAVIPDLPAAVRQGNELRYCDGGLTDYHDPAQYQF